MKKMYQQFQAQKRHLDSTLTIAYFDAEPVQAFYTVWVGYDADISEQITVSISRI